MYNMYTFYLTVGIQLNDSAITDTDAKAVGVWFVSSPMNVWNETFTPDVRTISWLEDLTDQLLHQLDEYLQTRQEHDILPCSVFLCFWMFAFSMCFPACAFLFVSVSKFCLSFQLRPVLLWKSLPLYLILCFSSCLCS